MPHRIVSRLSLLALLAMLAPTLSVGEEFEQHDAHEHGRVTLDVALEGGTLVVEWSAPALQVVGFEHAPRTEAERAALASATAWINRGNGVVGVPPAARCRLRSIQHAPPTLAGHRDAAGKTDHDAEHADFRARVSYECAAPAALTWLEPWVLRQLRGVERVEINLVAPGLQRQSTGASAETRVPLR
ncbi:MAG: ZrgA family zinc uptake protein [Steroidobacteraceae bacterium]|jgi:hypothetical protein